MSAPRRHFLLGLTAALAAGGLSPSSALAARDRKPRETLFIGLDTSGSFQRAGYEDALAFLAYYIYGHLNGLGGLSQPREMFVAGIGGRDANEPKAFHPIHDFTDKSIPEIERDLREWFPPTDTLTDFNAFLKKVARIATERNLVLRPISIVIVTDGVPDLARGRAGSQEAYRRINLEPLEYLARRVTLRLAYTSPPVAERWRTLVPRQRVRMWTVDDEVMRGWRAQLKPDVEPAGQDLLWKWVRENVDFRVRRGI